MKKILEAIDHERWGKSDVVIVGKRGAFQRLVGEPERQAHNECLDRVEAAIRRLREMKPYTADCKPQEPGWYWYYCVGDDDTEAEPAFYGGVTWYESDLGNDDLQNPDFWLEMEPPSVPEGEA